MTGLSKTKLRHILHTTTWRRLLNIHILTFTYYCELSMPGPFWTCSWYERRQPQHRRDSDRQVAGYFFFAYLDCWVDNFQAPALWLRLTLLLSWFGWALSWLHVKRLCPQSASPEVSYIRIRMRRRETDKQRVRQAESHSGRRQADSQINRQTDRQTARQTDKQTNRQIGRQTNRQTNRPTDRQTDLLQHDATWNG